MGPNSQPPPAAAVALAQGQVVAGKYLLVRQLGEGGMCVVYEAEHVNLRQALALKVLKPELAGDPGSVTRFEREARASAQLRSPNVAKVFDVDYLPTGAPYITMELLVGQDLGAELARSGRLPVDLAVDYVRQACSGIAEAHALGIVHRDLKPENLFLTELGELTDRKLLKILDFGIAKNISDSARKLTAPDAVFGTVDYMSPEQIRSASMVDHRTDLWSLGVILYELLTGRTPYHGDARSVIAQIVSDPVRPPTALVSDLPLSLVATVMKALHKDPAQRFQSADEMREALGGYGEFEPITSVIARLPPQSVPRRTARSASSGQHLGPVSESMREARTHASWETKTEGRGWGKTWMIVPFAALLLGTAAGVLYYRGQPLALSSFYAGGAAPSVELSPSAALPLPATSVATATPAPAIEGTAAASTAPPATALVPTAAAEAAEAAESAAPPATAAEPAAGSTPSAPPKVKPARPRTTAAAPAPTAPAPTAPPPATPPPPSATSTSRLPKHL